MAFAGTYPPATVDLPVYKALRADLAASGKDALQPRQRRGRPMRSWIGLYALLRMIRDSKMTTFTREGMMAMLQSAKDVPMLDMFGGENWTPDVQPRRRVQAGGHEHLGHVEVGSRRHGARRADRQLRPRCPRWTSTRSCAARRSVARPRAERLTTR